MTHKEIESHVSTAQNRSQGYHIIIIIMPLLYVTLTFEIFASTVDMQPYKL